MAAWLAFFKRRNPYYRDVEISANFDLRKDVNAKTRKVFAEIMKKSMQHFDRDHSKPSFWKVAIAKIPGPLKRRSFEYDDELRICRRV